MLTMYLLTGLGFAALIAARCLRNDRTAMDYIESALAMAFAALCWPVLLAMMVWVEAGE